MTHNKSRRLKKNLKSFSKKEVDVAKYVRDFYVDNGLAYISCNVDDYYDVIDDYSVDGYEWLNEGFVRFLESNAMYVPTEYPIVLEICGHHFNRKEKDVIIETISDYYALEQGDIQLNIEKLARRNWVRAGLSVLGIFLMWLGNKTSISVLSEATLVFFWFAFWDLLESLIFERKDLFEEKTDAAQMANIKVIFKEVYYDAPVSEDKEQEIIAEIFEDVEEPDEEASNIAANLFDRLKGENNE